MAEDTDVEDALDMSLKAGENEERQIVEVRSGRNGENRGKIPLARIERRSLGGGQENQHHSCANKIPRVISSEKG